MKMKPALICFYIFFAVVLAKKRKIKTSISGRKESDQQCFQSGKTWNTKNHIKTKWHIDSKKKCLKECVQETRCKGFTFYREEKKGGRKLRDVCVLFDDTKEEHVQNCKDCVSGEMDSCLCRYGKNCSLSILKGLDPYSYGHCNMKLKK